MPQIEKDSLDHKSALFAIEVLAADLGDIAALTSSGGPFLGWSIVDFYDKRGAGCF